MYEEMTPLIDNTIFEAYIQEDITLYYKIRPCKEYKLHENSLDIPILDAVGNPTGEVEKGYTSAFIIVGSNYNFEENPGGIYAIHVNGLIGDDENE